MTRDERIAWVKEQILSEMPKENIISQILEEFGVKEATAENYIDDALGEMVEQGQEIPEMYKGEPKGGETPVDINIEELTKRIEEGVMSMPKEDLVATIADEFQMEQADVIVHIDSVVTRLLQNGVDMPDAIQFGYVSEDQIGGDKEQEAEISRRIEEGIVSGVSKADLINQIVTDFNLSDEDSKARVEDQVLIMINAGVVIDNGVELGYLEPEEVSNDEEEQERLFEERADQVKDEILSGRPKVDLEEQLASEWGQTEEENSHYAMDVINRALELIQGTGEEIPNALENGYISEEEIAQMKADAEAKKINELATAQRVAEEKEAKAKEEEAERQRKAEEQRQAEQAEELSKKAEDLEIETPAGHIRAFKPDGDQTRTALFSDREWELMGGANNNDGWKELIITPQEVKDLKK